MWAFLDKRVTGEKKVPEEAALKMTIKISSLKNSVNVEKCKN